MNTKMWIFTGAAVVAILTAALWTNVHDHHDHDHDEHEEHTFVHMDKEQIQKYGIDINNVASGTLKNIVKAPAIIVIPSDQMAHVYPKAAGTVVAAYKNLGENVEPGDLLATIESQEVAETKAGYLAALKQEGLMFREHARELKLADKKISSDQEYAAAQHALESSQIALELAKHKLYALGFNANDIEAMENAPASQLSVYEVRAPIAGKIIERNITKGSLVGADQEIFEIGNVAKVWAEINVFPQDRQHMKQGQSVTINSDHGASTKGDVLFLSPVIDTTTRTSKAIVVVDNADGQWLPGTFTNAAVVTKETPAAMTVSKDSIQNIEGDDCVFVKEEEGFALRQITRGQEDQENVEVLSGLNPGEKVACKNTFLLKAELLKDEAEHMD